MISWTKAKPIVTIFVITSVGLLLILAYWEGRKEQMIEQEWERPVKALSRVSIVNGENIIRLDKTTRLKSGIITESCKRGSVPESAVVWLQGKMYAYVQNGEDLFVRREVIERSSPASKTQDYIFKIPLSENRVVVKGAQLLLSEEYREEIIVGERGE
jgi:hypothetical protein